MFSYIQLLNNLLYTIMCIKLIIIVFKLIFLLDLYCIQSMDLYVEHDDDCAFFLYLHEDDET